MLRYEVEINDLPQAFTLSGNLRHVASALFDVVEFWAEDEPGAPTITRTFQVYGTGNPIPDHAVWRGTTDRTPEGAVWHLYELPTESK